MSTETRPFQAEIRQLLHILIHSLYTDREIFLRELISNASDALNRIQFEMLTNHAVADPDAELAIRIRVDGEARTITISDTGIGMSHDELAQNLGTIARSGASAFVRSLQEGERTVDQIGQFGVGFYSVFMVADEVQVTSRSYRPEDAAWTWIATGEDAFRLEPAEKVGRGTDILIKLKEDAAEFTQPYRLKSIIRKHSDFISFPIFVGDDTDPANRRDALWRQSSAAISDDAANAFYQQLTLDHEPPLLRVHVNTDAPAQIYALLFVPAKLPGSASLRQDFGLKLYSHKILIQEHAKDVVPTYLRFLEGVADSEDLPLNVSRETVQSSPVMRRIRTVLTRRVLDALKELGANEPERYQTFWAEFGPFLKEGVISEPGDRERLLPLLRFHSSRAAAPVSLHQYVGGMKPDQKQIYYLVSDDLRLAQRSPHLDYFRRENIEVLFFTDPIDGFLPSALGEFEGFALQHIAEAGLELPEKDSETADAPQSEQLVIAFKARLGDKVLDVRASDLLSAHPARLVAPEHAYGSEMERVRRLTERDYQAPPKVLEINPRHPLLASLNTRLAGTGDDMIAGAIIEQVYENALLLEGLHPNPADIVERVQQLMEAAARA